MRPLQEFVGQELYWQATVGNFGTHKRQSIETVLLLDIKSRDYMIEIRHCWIISTPSLNSSLFKKGQIIQFRASIRPYTKQGKEDYGLYRPNQIKIIGREPRLDPIRTLEPSKRININEILNESRSKLPKR